ncbi:unnamed protein product [Rotaria socialis]
MVRLFIIEHKLQFFYVKTRVKVDAKTKALLDEYKKKKRHELAKKAAKDTTAFKFVYEDDDDEEKTSNSKDKKSGEEGEIEEEEDDYIDSETRREDNSVKQSLETIMREYSREMNQRALEAKEMAAREAQMPTNPMLNMLPPSMPQLPIPSNTTDSPLPDTTSSNSTSPGTRRVADPAATLDDEEGKRSLITNEIQMFRDRFKDEETKMRNTEKERKDRYERERKKRAAAEEAATSENNKSSLSPSSRNTPPPPSSSSSRDRSSPKHDRSSSNRRDRSSPSDDRYRSSSSRNNTSNSVRSRASDRRSSPVPRSDRRSPAPLPRPFNRRSRTKSPLPRAHTNDEDDDEVYERRRQERRLNEKERRYRDRLRAWEQRERKKQSDHDDEKSRELKRLHDEETEGKRLLAFFEEYNDENDDLKHYKGTSLARRLKDREREIEIDNRDRRNEKEEIEELRKKLLLQNNIDDIESEIKRRLEKEEELIRKRLADLTRGTSDESADESDNDEETTNKRKSTKIPSPEPGNTSTELMDQSSPAIVLPQYETKVSPRQTSALGGAPITGTKLPSKRKLAVNEAFRDDQDEENTNSFQKKSKLSAILDQQTTPISQSSSQIKDEQANRAAVGKRTPVTPTSNVTSTQSQEEKRQAVRKLIESIPTKKEDLFTFPLDWSLLDTNLMEKRIKPWVTKKIVEYIGEEELTLTEFICSSIMSKKSAETILYDIRVVLDDEAEVFVVKMWRLIVYEIEAKRHGINK